MGTVNCVQNIALIYGIYSKLIEKPREVNSICIAKGWLSVDALNHFGDQKGENGLLFDLDQIRQNHNKLSRILHQIYIKPKCSA